MCPTIACMHPQFGPTKAKTITIALYMHVGRFGFWEDKKRYIEKEVRDVCLLNL